MKKILLYTILLLAGFASCRKDVYENTKRNTDTAYYNQTIRTGLDYDVEEIIYDDFRLSIDTHRYQLREYNESFFTDNIGRRAIRIDRYRRSNDSALWTYLNTWSCVVGPDRVERIENNKRYIKLSFPMHTDAVWNANAYNMDYTNTVYYTGLHRSYTLDTFRFDSAVVVESNYTNTALRERAYREVYVRHTGLVEKHFVSIEKTGTLQRGVRLRMQLRKYVH